MSQEIIDALKYFGSAVVGAGFTLAIFLKFGEKIFFKHLDHKYSERLSKKNIELQSELEETKNSLNKSLQQDVAKYKADLEIFSGQRARYLERRIDSILEINKFYVLSINSFAEYIDITHSYIQECADYFLFQVGNSNLISYETYAELKREHWPKKQTPAISSISKYSEILALKLPILPKQFAEKELELVSELNNIMDSSRMLFYRTLGLTYEIIEPEEGMTREECLAEFEEITQKSLILKDKIFSYKENLLEKANESNLLIESLLSS